MNSATVIYVCIQAQRWKELSEPMIAISTYGLVLLFYLPRISAFSRALQLFLYRQKLSSDESSPFNHLTCFELRLTVSSN